MEETFPVFNVKYKVLFICERWNCCYIPWPRVRE